jgi:bifunctional non-homologous end joining protein LigD
MALALYNEKRNFSDTPEPEGKKAKKNLFRFVVQRHEASRLHYDFRLELDGVLKSWAVPKGPSLNPKDKRLAMMVEDHPVGYIDFEGRIPEGNYGAGTVMIWDKGEFYPVNEKSEKITEKQALQNLENGQLKFYVNGNKLRGEFVLVRLKADEKNNSWLLIKHRDDFALDAYNSEDHITGNGKKAGRKPAIATAASQEDESSNQVKKTGAQKAPSRKAQPSVPPSAKAVKKKPDSQKTVAVDLAATTGKYDDYYKPMLATLADQPFDNPDWVFEIKWDGFRAVAEWQNKQLKFYSRNGLSFVSRYPTISNALRKLKHDAVIDGEIVMFNENDRPDFQKLQQYEDNKHLPLIYYVFDLLFLNGEDLRKLPLLERKKRLKKLIGKNEVIRYCDHFEQYGIDFFNKAAENNLEGIIAKRSESGYTTGVRTKEWLKIKHQLNREAIIVGYTEPRNSRKYFGALILAEYEGKNLKYLGHTGTGFNTKTLKELWDKMQPLKTGSSPFKERIKVNAPVTWIKPKLVCQLHFTEVTEGGMLRHPVFLGLRTDKTFKEVQKIDEEAQQIIPVATTIKNSKPAREEKKVKDNDVITLDGHDVPLTNLNKIYWPEEKITKGDLINYYKSIAPYLIPYLKDRPLSLKRNPNGIMDKGFFHKDAGGGAPSWVNKVDIYSGANDRIISYLICNDTASLVYIANLGCIEINPWNSTAQKQENPDYLVIDLDPSDANSFEQVIETANVVKDILDNTGATAFCKTSGATGLHIYIPLGAKYTYDEAKEFGNLIAIRTQQQLPEFTSVERSLSKRGNKIYIDYLQNRKGQTLASVYSVRPKAGATVSTPLEWSEVKPGLQPSQFDIWNIADRIKEKGDLFKGVLGKGIDLKKCLKKLS